MTNIFNTNPFPYFGYIFAVISILPKILYFTLFRPKYEEVKYNKLGKREKTLLIIKYVIYILNILILFFINKKLDVKNIGWLFGISLFFYVIHYEMFFRYVIYGRYQKILYDRFLYIRIPYYVSEAFANLFVALWSRNVIYIIFSILFLIIDITVENLIYLKYFTEYRELYSKGRKKTGKKMLKDSIVPRGLKYVSVVIFIYDPENGKFLMQKRTKDKGGKWATTSGHPVYGKTSIEGIICETKEELGIDISKNDIEYISTIERKKKYVDIYYVELSSNIIDKVVMQKDEVDDVKWISKREIEALHDKKKFKETHYNYYLELLKYKKFK